jgi:hypothetical protein
MSPSKTEVLTTFLNVVLHIFILWTLLVGFFFLYISKVIRESLQNQIGGQIDDAMNKSLNDLTPVQQMRLKIVLRNMPLDELIEVFSKETDAVAVNNKWLLIVSALISFFFIMSFVLILTILKYSSPTKVSAKHILMENAIVFTFIGAVEFVFFMYIALKFIPVMPSVATKTIIERVKTNFG